MLGTGDGGARHGQGARARWRNGAQQPDGSEEEFHPSLCVEAVICEPVHRGEWGEERYARGKIAKHNLRDER